MDVEDPFKDFPPDQFDEPEETKPKPAAPAVAAPGPAAPAKKVAPIFAALLAGNKRKRAVLEDDGFEIVNGVGNAAPAEAAAEGWPEAAAAAEAEPAAEGKDVSRMKKNATPAQVLEHLDGLKTFAWAELTGTAAVGRLAVHSFIKCTPCGCLVKFDTSSGKGNLFKHAATKSHTAAAAAVAAATKLKLGVAPGPTSAAAAAAEGGKAAAGGAGAAADEESPREQARGIRYVLTAHLMLHMSKDAIKEVFTDDVMDMLNAVTTFCKTVGSDGTLSRDIPVSLEAVKARIKQLVAGTIGCIVADGASTAFLGGEKPVAVMYETSSLPRPALLAVLFGASKSGDLANGIKAVLLEYGMDIKTQITEFMGDNASVNSATATLLGLPCGKCWGHAMNLAAKEGTKAFPHLEPALFCLSTVLTAGGTTRRRQELAAWRGDKISVSKLAVHSNRFITLLQAIHYLRQPLGDKAAGGAGAAAGDEDADDEDAPLPGAGADEDMDAYEERQADPCGVMKAVRHWLINGETLKKDDDSTVATALHGARAVWSTAEKLFECLLYFQLHQPLLFLVPMASSAVSNTPHDLIAKVKAYRDVLVATVGDEAKGIASMAKAHYDNAVKDYDLLFTKKEEETVIKASLAKLKASAAAALAKLDDHVNLTGDLGKKALYDPRNPPKRWPPAGMAAPGVAEIRAYFGCSETYAGVPLVSQYSSWVADYALETAAERTGTMHAYWTARCEKYPLLAKLGLWYAEIQSSSISAERCFGIMRGMEDSARYNMKKTAFVAELTFKVNKWVVQDMTKTAAATSRTLMKGLQLQAVWQ